MSVRTSPARSLFRPSFRFFVNGAFGVGSLLVALGLLALACQSPPGPEPRPLLADTNILLVVVDTLGSRHVGSLARNSAVGDPEAVAQSPTPNLDRLAEGGVLFRRAYSTAPWTQPAFGSLLTSKMPSRHGLKRLFDVLGEDEITLPEMLRDQGFATSGVVAHDLLKAEYGFAQGFQSYDESSALGHRGISSKQVTDIALDWLQQRPEDKPFFLMAHYFDPHFAYQHHPAYDRSSSYDGSLTPGMKIWDLRHDRDQLSTEDLDYLRALYQEEIAHTDHHIGRLVESLAVADPARRTLIVVTADHGEEFMEHGWIGHTRTLYEELLQVPLIMHLPGVLEAREVETPVSLVDIAPTLLAGLSPPVISSRLSFSQMSSSSAAPSLGENPGVAKLFEEHMEGESLWGLMSLPGEEEPAMDLKARGEGGRGLEDEFAGVSAGRRVWAEVSFEVDAEQPDFHHEKVAFGTTLIAGDLKMIHDQLRETWQLFDLEADPREQYPLPPSDPRFRDLQGQLVRWEREQGQEVEVSRRTPSGEELDRLRSLGYLK